MEAELTWGLRKDCGWDWGKICPEPGAASSDDAEADRVVGLFPRDPGRAAGGRWRPFPSLPRTMISGSTDSRLTLHACVDPAPIGVLMRT